MKTLKKRHQNKHEECNPILKSIEKNSFYTESSKTQNMLDLETTQYSSFRKLLDEKKNLEKNIFSLRQNRPKFLTGLNKKKIKGKNEKKNMVGRKFKDVKFCLPPSKNELVMQVPDIREDISNKKKASKEVHNNFNKSKKR